MNTKFSLNEWLQRINKSIELVDNINIGNIMEDIVEDISATLDNPPGHNYILQKTNGWSNGEIEFSKEGRQSISFICKDKDTGKVTAGVTNEQIALMLLDRMHSLNTELPCVENEKAIMALEEFLHHLITRQRNRTAQNVLGKHEHHKSE